MTNGRVGSTTHARSWTAGFNSIGGEILWQVR